MLPYRSLKTQWSHQIFLECCRFWENYFHCSCMYKLHLICSEKKYFLDTWGQLKLNQTAWSYFSHLSQIISNSITFCFSAYVSHVPHSWVEASVCYQQIQSSAWYSHKSWSGAYIYPSVYLFVCLSVCLFVCLSVCLSVCLLVCLFVCLFVSSFVSSFVC